jgi:hypothetical protein
MVNEARHERKVVNTYLFGNHFIFTLDWIGTRLTYPCSLEKVAYLIIELA